MISACGPVSAPGTYTVTKDITAPPSTNCITITGSGVAIDLQGHTISGSGFSSGVIGGPSHIIVANGTITGFNQNINLVGSEPGLLLAGPVIDGTCEELEPGSFLFRST